MEKWLIEWIKCLLDYKVDATGQNGGEGLEWRGGDGIEWRRGEGEVHWMGLALGGSERREGGGVMDGISVKRWPGRCLEAAGKGRGIGKWAFGWHDEGRVAERPPAWGGGWLRRHWRRQARKGNDDRWENGFLADPKREREGSERLLAWGGGRRGEMVCQECAWRWWVREGENDRWENGIRLVQGGEGRGGCRYREVADVERWLAGKAPGGGG